MWGREGLFILQTGKPMDKRGAHVHGAVAPCLGPPVLGDILKVDLIYIRVTDLKILRWLKTLEPT